MNICKIHTLKQEDRSSQAGGALDVKLEFDQRSKAPRSS